VDKVADGPDRLAAELGEFSRGRLDERRAILAWPQADNGEVARRARAHVDAQQNEQGVRVAAGRQRDDHIPAFSGQQRRRLLANAERLTGRGRLGSPAAAAGQEAR
jgi:hypothetical protein